MSEHQPEDLNSQAVPFFARFLEGQNVEEISDEESEAFNGGLRFYTKKHPSDQEDGGGGVQTLKYPSDNEDVVTKKYPSDNDEAVTLKYPSDGDDQIIPLQ
ncbi:MAG: microviridin/marinostatin family tricyclic proteinase inhibitor [Gloeotrichia echinulata GP01]